MPSGIVAFLLKKYYKEENKNMKKILYCRVAWMDFYNFEICPIDRIDNGGSHPAKGKHEIYNFQKINNWFYGYVQIPKTINIVKNLGAYKDDLKVEHISVVWVATNPQHGGQVIVGWYNDANVYKENQSLHEEALENRPKHDVKVYNISSKSAFLLPIDKRKFNICKTVLGQNQFGYGDDKTNKKVFR